MLVKEDREISHEMHISSQLAHLYILLLRDCYLLYHLDQLKLWRWSSYSLAHSDHHNFAVHSDFACDIEIWKQNLASWQGACSHWSPNSIEYRYGVRWKGDTQRLAWEWRPRANGNSKKAIACQWPNLHQGWWPRWQTITAEGNARSFGRRRKDCWWSIHQFFDRRQRRHKINCDQKHRKRVVHETQSKLASVLILLWKEDHKEQSDFLPTFLHKSDPLLCRLNHLTSLYTLNDVFDSYLAALS